MYFPYAATSLPDRLSDSYENEAAKYWDRFYKRNAANFFKDRHYLDKEFPHLCSGPCVVLEVGCGVGNTVFPLLDVNPHLSVHACDFSPTAITILKEHPAYASGRVHAFVADITTDDLAQNVPVGSVDLCTMLFVLSAIAPANLLKAISHVARVLKPGGCLLFRDYADNDLAQQRLEAHQRLNKLGDNFFVRGDGTCCHYFTLEQVRQLFEGAGFTCDSLHVVERDVPNRKQQIVMHRRWVQATCTLVNPPLTGPLTAHMDPTTQHPAPHGGIVSTGQQLANLNLERESPSTANGSVRAANVLETEPSLSLVDEEWQCRGLTFHARCPPQHIAGHSRAVAAMEAFILTHPNMFVGQRVLELAACSSSRLVVCCLQWCRGVVAALPSQSELKLVLQNLRDNGDRIVVERAACCCTPLADNDVVGLSALEKPQSSWTAFDLIIWAGLIPAGWDVTHIFKAASHLLSQNPGSRFLMPSVELLIQQAHSCGLAIEEGDTPSSSGAMDMDNAGHSTPQLQPQPLHTPVCILRNQRLCASTRKNCQ